MAASNRMRDHPQDPPAADFCHGPEDPSFRLRRAQAVRSPEVAATGQGRTSVRVKVAGSGDSNIETGVPVLDHLLGLLATHASFDLALSVEPGNADAEIDAAARALGEALEEPLRAPGARGDGSAAIPADEALEVGAGLLQDRS